MSVSRFDCSEKAVISKDTNSVFGDICDVGTYEVMYHIAIVSDLVENFFIIEIAFCSGT